MKALNHKLDHWVNEGFISADQAKAIERHEQQTPRKQWAIFAIAGLGVTAFITGVISLIAGNWETISVTSKIVSYFMIQVGLGAMFLAFRDQDGWVRELSLAMFALLFLGGIGLISQIYNLKGEAWEMLFFWVALVMPATLLARSRFTYHFWVAGLYSAAFFWLNYGTEKAPHLLPISFMLTVALIYGGFAAGIWRMPALTLPDTFRAAWLTWSIVLLLGAVTSTANLLWYQNTAQKVIENLPSFRSYAIIPWIACLLSVGALYLSRPKYSTWFRGSCVTVLVSICTYLTIPLLFEVGEQKVVGCIGFILIWGIAAAAASFAKRPRLFDIATLVIVARFIMVYLEVFKSATDTGIGLMVSGTMILVLAFGWRRYRRRIENWLAARE